MNDFNLKINRVIETIRVGKPVIVTDHEDRENEGDFIMAAQDCTPEWVNFMLVYGKGLICTPITSSKAKLLGLNLMSPENSSTHYTNFTISIDARIGGTGISAEDRSLTMKLLANPKIIEQDFVKPGHVFPLIAKDGLLRERDGHTEASLELMKLANKEEVAVICEILDKDGSIAGKKRLLEISKEFDIPIISVDEIRKWVYENHSISFLNKTNLPTKYGKFSLYLFKNKDGNEIPVLKSEKVCEIPNVRIHSECMTGDLFHSLRCDCGDQLEAAMNLVAKEGGIIIYLRQEGRGIGLKNKIDAYNLQDSGMDTDEANLHLGFLSDQRTYAEAGEILNFFKYEKINLITNNMNKKREIEKYGIMISSVVSLASLANKHNFRYLKTKINKFNHNIKIENEGDFYEYH